MEGFLQVETLVIELLLVVSLVAIAVRRLKFPYTVALVIVGLLITLRQPIQINPLPELILGLFVPPLVFEAAFHLNMTHLQRNLPIILLWAVPGVIVTTLIVGGFVALTTPLTLGAALVLGALLSATDPVAVVALFRALHVPKRLEVLIEGESLLNDGTAIVVFNLMLVVALTGRFDLLTAAGDFVRVAAGGVIIGLVLGWLVARLIARLDDHLIVTTLTMVLAFGSYLVADRLHFSGVLAVVAAGLVNGNLGPRSLSPATRIVLFNFWEAVAFLANSLVFLLIGVQVDPITVLAAWQPVLCAVAAVLVARAVIVYGLGWVTGHLGEPVPLRWQHVLNWGGLRGAIGLALAISLPVTLGAQRSLLQVMAFGVVLFTLLVQGTTMGPLLRRLNIAVRTPVEQEYEMRRARLTILETGGHHLEYLHHEGLLSPYAWEVMRRELTKRAAALGNAVAELLRANPALQAEDLAVARREFRHAQRSALLRLREAGLISEETFDKLMEEVDAFSENGEEVEADAEAGAPVASDAA